MCSPFTQVCKGLAVKPVCACKCMGEFPHARNPAHNHGTIACTCAVMWSCSRAVASLAIVRGRSS